MSVNATSTCYDYTDIINNGGLVTNNSDGTVSVFVKNNVGVLIPVGLTLKCCNLLNQTNPLGGYYWDGRDQNCKWNAFNPNQLSGEACSIENEFNLVLNPNGNDGALFSLNGQSNPSLTINFDYLFKFKCETLYGIITGAQGSPSQSPSDRIIQVQSFQGPTVTELKTAGGVQIFTPFSFDYTNGSAAQMQTKINQHLVNGFTIGTVTKPSTSRFAFSVTSPTILVNNGQAQLLGGPGVLGAYTTIYISGGVAPSTQSSCTTPVEALETLDVSMTLDIVNPDNSITHVFEEPIFQQIGNNMLMNYLLTNTDTGFYICGDPVLGDPVGLTACTPATNLITTQNVFSCNNLINNIKSDIGNNIPVNAFNSNWLNYNNVITNPTILSQINNKKIRLSLKVNEACVDFCALVDNIKLESNVTSISNTNIFLTQSPGFTLDRVRDNKKSWVKNTSPEEREFGISRVDGSNSIRLTDYNVNDERLVINSKEIDLDISLASAIETDVWGYIVDNPCLLTGITSPCSCTNGLCIQTELVLNGGFDTDLTDWVTSSWIWNAGTAYLSEFFAPQTLTQDLSDRLIDGQVYTLTFTVSNFSGAVGLRAGLFETTSLGIVANGTYSITRVYSASGSGLINFQNQGAITVSIDDVSLMVDCPSGATGTTIALGGLQSQNAMVSIGNPYQFVDDASTVSFEQDFVTSPVVGNYYTVNYTISNMTGGSVGVYLFLAGNPGVKHDEIRTSNGTYNLTKQYMGATSTNVFGVVETSNSPLTIITVNSITFTSGPSMGDFLQGCCGDSSVDYNELITQPLSSVTTVEDFDYFLSSELIDAKDRKTLSAYPTLRGLYDRYLNSSGYCSQISSAFDYQSMEQFAGLVGNYWVDIIEQVIPATTIWGATKIYSNTIFDSQKFKYKAYTLLMGDNIFDGITPLSPCSGTSSGVTVVTTVINPTGNTLTSTYTNPYIIQMNSGSEFIGSVTIIGGSGGSQNSQTLFAG